MSDREMIREIARLREQLARLESNQPSNYVPRRATPLTSTSWDGDARSTTAKTLIDLSAVFGVPAGVRAVEVSIYIRDSASAGTNLLGIFLAPNDTASSGVFFSCGGMPNDFYAYRNARVPCNSDGDIYFQTVASGASTLDVGLEIWGWEI